MKLKILIVFATYCVVTGLPTHQLFSRPRRQRGEYWLDHYNTVYALMGKDGSRIKDFSSCGGIIGCGLVDIIRSGKKRSVRTDNPGMKSNINGETDKQRVVERLKEHIGDVIDTRQQSKDTIPSQSDHLEFEHYKFNQNFPMIKQKLEKFLEKNHFVKISLGGSGTENEDNKKNISKLQN